MMMSNQPNVKYRDHSIDIAKGIGILLVVLGHLQYVPAGLNNYIYTFHIPLFAFAMGVFLNVNKSLKTVIIEKSNRLLKPFFIYSLISWIIYTILVFIQYPNLISEQIYKLLYICAGSGQNAISQFGMGNVALWFLPFALIVSLFNFGINKYVNLTILKLGLVLLSALIGYVFAKFNVKLPANLDTAFILFPLCFLGIYYKKIKSYLLKFNRTLLSISVLIALAIHFYVFKTNGNIDLASAVTGDNIIMFYIGSLSMIYVIFMLSNIIKHNKWLEYQGENSIVILITHLPVFQGLWFLYSLTGLNLPNMVVASLIFLVYIVLIAPILIHLINKYWSRSIH